MNVEDNEARAGGAPLLRQPLFVALLLAALVSNVGSGMQAFSEQGLVVQMAGPEAARWAGRLGFAGGFAMLLLMPFGGALGDRFDRRRLLAISQAWLAGIALVMGVLAAQSGGLTLVRLVACAAATGVGLALMSPILNSLFPSVVTRDELAAASGYMSAQFNVSRIVGPALAAVVLSAWGASGNFLVNAVSFAGLIVVAFRLPAPAVVADRSDRGSYLLALRHCRDDAQLRVALVLSVFAGAFAWSYHTFVTVYAVRYLDATAGGAATLLGVYGLGAILGALYLSRDRGRTPWPRLRTCLGTYGAGLVVMGAVPHPVVSPMGAFVLGVSHAVFGTLLSVIVQHRAPEAIRSRVTAIYLTAILGTTPLGNLVAGEVAQWLGVNGVRWTLGAQGAILIAAAAWASWRMADGRDEAVSMPAASR
jgi:MFS family permease